MACPICKSPTRPVGEPSCNVRGEHARPPRPLEILVDNVRSVFNVGSIFRSADGAGVSELHLCGITPTPKHPAMKKTALGAEESLPWSQSLNGLAQAQRLIGAGHKLWALEGTIDSVPLFSAAPDRPEGPLVLVVGNEVSGVDPAIMALCQQIVTIPMAGVKDSLNVASALAVAVYALV